jgi:cysteine desulfurase
MVYLDYNATTPTDPVVADAMTPFLLEEYGNPSSQHPLGQRAREAMDSAREEVASLVGCHASEVVFTSGGSESNNMVIKGLAAAYRGRPCHIITTQVEHPAVMEPCRFLETEGVDVTYIGVDRQGRIDPGDVRKALRSETILITVMHANNETGALQPIAQIGEISSEAGVLFHTDAAQTVGKIPLTVESLNVDFLTVAGHKLYAPKGIGALYIRGTTPLIPLIQGAGQEGGRRAGTENVLLSVGLGAACRLARALQGDEGTRIQKLRDYLHKRLKEIVPELVLNGPPTERLPGTLNVSFPGVEGAEVLRELGQVCASTGSACHEGSREISPVLRAMGTPEEIALGAVRFSLGRWTTQEELDQVIEAVVRWAGKWKSGPRFS